jgi:hypothetical protein
MQAPGSRWNMDYLPDGNMRGFDRRGNARHDDHHTGNYWNSNGRTCFGKGAFRTCHKPVSATSVEVNKGLTVWSRRDTERETCLPQVSSAIGSCLFAGAHVHRLWVVTQREALAEPGLEVREGVQQAPAALDQGVRREGGYAAETPWRETH